MRLGKSKYVAILNNDKNKAHDVYGINWIEETVMIKAPPEDVNNKYVWVKNEGVLCVMEIISL